MAAAEERGRGGEGGRRRRGRRVRCDPHGPLPPPSLLLLLPPPPPLLLLPPQGVWVGLYANEYWTWVVGSRAYLAYLAHLLAGEASAPPPPTRYPGAEGVGVLCLLTRALPLCNSKSLPSLADYDFMQYECPLHSSTGCANFPFAKTTPFFGNVSWDVLPRVTCLADAPAAAWGGSAAGAVKNNCVSSPAYLLFNGTEAAVAMFTNVNPLRGAAPGSVQIRYSLDGSPVTPASSLYTAPFNVSGNLTVRVRSFDGPSGTPFAVESSLLVVQQEA